MSSDTQTTADILSSTNLSLKTRKRDKLFHDNYRYAVDFYVAAGPILRGMHRPGELKRSDIPEMFEKRKQSLKQYFPMRQHAVHVIMDNRILMYEDKRSLEALIAAYDLLKGLKDIKLSVKHQFITIYCNTLEFIPSLERYVSKYKDTFKHAVSQREKIYVTEAILDRPRDSIRRKKSDWKYRIQMRHASVNEAQHAGLRSFVETYLGVTQPSESLVGWCRRGHRNWNTLESHFFIDTNDKKLPAMLEICAPGCVGKVLDIIVDK